MSGKVPAKKGQQTTAVSQQQVMAVKHHQGPLPPPEDLASYDTIVPGFAERIVVMAEEQARHRYGMEEKALESDIKCNNRILTERRIGQFMAFIIVVLMLCVGAYLILHGFPVQGTIFGGIGIVPVIWAFVPKNGKAKKNP